MKNKLVIGAFALMLAAFIVILSLPADTESIEAENRTAATAPPLSEETVFSGEFASGFESFIGDSVGYRSFFTQLSKQIESLEGFTPDTGSVISANKDIGTGTTQKMTLLVADGAIMEMFARNEDNERLYTEMLNHYAEKLPEDIELFNMIIPTQLEFKEPIYKNLQDSQKDAIDAIYAGLDERVTAVDAYSALEEHKDEYIYLRTDHHWTPLGAYYAYRAFISAEGGKAVDKDDFESGAIQNFLGYLYDRVNSSDFEAEPDVIEWYDVDPDEHITTVMHGLDDDGNPTTYKGTMYDHTKANYSFFFGSDHPIVEMTNEDNIGGKTIVLLKESYSNALAPWLIKSYYKVILVDPRIYKGDFEDVLDDYSPDEVMIVNYIFTTNFPDYCALLTDLY
ncbi:MAG: hypothetical protein LIO53_03055 [Oscillospiraceae bacterium]|nr:hypothetical protein [Oscillospiraceae bacterium]